MSRDGAMFDVNKAASLGNEEECARYLEAVIWPDSPTCRPCLSYEHSGEVIPLRDSARIVSAAHVYMCKYCRRQFSVLTGTIFERTHLPLSKWFKAIKLVFNNPSMTVKDLQGGLSTSYKTAWVLRTIIRTIPEYEIGDYGVAEKKPAFPRQQRRWIYAPFLETS